MNITMRRAATLSLLIKVSKCDGFMHANELRVINAYIQKHNIHERDVKRFDNQSLRELSRIIGGKMLSEHKNIINKLIVADGVIHPNEKAILNDIG
jgi:uncharacterized tellurite resistance protein B-like protein